MGSNRVSETLVYELSHPFRIEAQLNVKFVYWYYNTEEHIGFHLEPGLLFLLVIVFKLSGHRGALPNLLSLSNVSLSFVKA